MFTKEFSTDIKIFLDSADPNEIIEYYNSNRIKISGFTTNPTLMKNAGVRNYLSFIKDLLTEIKDLPISFEVFADDLKEMKRQALLISGMGSNVYVKIPITNTKAISTNHVIQDLNNLGVLCNITAITTIGQVKKILSIDNLQSPIIFSIFAGRVADTGINPIPLLAEICRLVESCENIEILWASTREALNIFQAIESGCDIITLTSPLLKKTEYFGKDLEDLSLETVKMFYDDAKSAGYKI